MKTVGWNPYECQICGGSLLHLRKSKKGITNLVSANGN